MYKTFQQCQTHLDGIQAIDFYLARQICAALEKAQDHLLFHSIMATSQALRNGHTCLKLDQEADASNETIYWHNQEAGKSGFSFPPVDIWQQHLSEIAISVDDKQPLVYENNRLYLRRYWQFEEELAAVIHQLIEKTLSLEHAQAQRAIDQLFPLKTHSSSNIKNDIDWQKIAVANALFRQFTIIAGGPGTGKTFTVTKILAALQSLSNNTLKIAMLAPTGKAAQRLNESIQKAKLVLQKNKLINDEILNSIPDIASTLHRLLGVIPGSHKFRFNEDHHLPYEVILVDEISMIDLPLMTRLMRAVNADCKIIMLGDADQLPSVAAGSILADLAPRQSAGYSAEHSRRLSELTGFDVPVLDLDAIKLDHLTVLQKSHRFDASGEIGRIAKQVISGKAESSWQLLEQGKSQVERVTCVELQSWIEQMVDQYYMPIFNIQFESLSTPMSASLSVNKAFAYLHQFRFLAATRLGEQGVTNINEMVEQYLRTKNLIISPNDFYPGRPIMVTENNYNVGLYNGDTGLIWNNEQGKLKAVFADNDSIRWVSLGRLPKVETVYAMTIHKTQGSEFSHVGLVLPERDSLILSRELLYTGITRASDKLSILGEKSIWELAVRRRVQRYSGLAEKVFYDNSE